MSAYKKIIKKVEAAPAESEESVNSDSEAEVQKLESEQGSEKDEEVKEEAVAEVDSEDELRAFKDPDPLSKEWKNRQRTLVLISRGIAGRFRHLVEDITSMIPNIKKESKIDRKHVMSVVNDLCFERSCNNLMYFEQRKQKDLFLWMAKSPNGPSIKFHVVNIHTFDELKLSGNCLKFSRPLLSFDGAFETSPHMKLIKEMLCSIFNTPKNHPKSKPFIDHVLSFNMTPDGRIWWRNY